jgi:SAM-dependent methyltransferase
VDAMFSAGDAYERFMGRWSRELAPLLVQFVGVHDGDRVLDVGSGTGSLAGVVAAAAPSSVVVGVDPSPPYVAFAQAQRGGARVRFEVGDAQALGFADDSFDVTLSSLILNFIPRADAALDEMMRVTRSGGIVAAAVWDYDDGMEMLRVFWDEAVALNPAIASRDERHMPFSRRGELAALWRQHGMRQVTDEPITITTRFASFDDYWSPFLDRQGPAGAYVASLSDENREQLRVSLQHRLGDERPAGRKGPPHKSDDREIALTARAWAVRGVVA